MNGIEPPTPMSTGCGAVPGLGEGGARRVVRRAGGVDPRWPRRCRRRVSEISAPHGTRSSRCRRRQATALSVVSPGAIRIEIRARAAGTRVLEAPVDLRGVQADDAQRRLGPQPLDGGARPDPVHPGQRPRTPRAAGPRGSPRRRPGPRDRPATATLPSSSCSVAISRLRVISASGTSPPHMPECTAWVRVRTSTSARTSPRRLVVSAGTSMSQLPESAITMTSARSRSWCSARNAGRDSQPTSSSPSTKSDDVRPGGRRRASAPRPGARRCRPCRRRHRARRAGRRARSARRAVRPSRRGHPRAGRRGGRRAGPSAHPPARPGGRSRPGRRRRRPRGSPR